MEIRVGGCALRGDWVSGNLRRMSEGATTDSRCIFHVDMDAFYASVEQLDNPQLVGKPVIVGGRAESRGVVAAASYEVRRFGVHSAMPMATALRLCPGAIVVAPRMTRYVTISRQIRDIFTDFTPLVEPISIDEAFLDVTGSQRLLGPPLQIAHGIKRRIRDETGLTGSIGVAPNKFLAKLASDLEKPDGLVVVEAAEVSKLLDPLPVEKLWGVGRAAQKKLNDNGIRTVADLKMLESTRLVGLLGSWGNTLHELSRGIDRRCVQTNEQAKSIGTESTFANDIVNREQLLDVLMGQVDQVAWRLRKANLEAGTMTLKIRYPNFHTITRGTSIDPPANIFSELWAVAAQLFDSNIGRDRQPIRLLGATASNLRAAGSAPQLLFAGDDREKQQKTDSVADEIRNRFGYDAIRRIGSGEGGRE